MDLFSPEFWAVFIAAAIAIGAACLRARQVATKPSRLLSIDQQLREVEWEITHLDQEALAFETSSKIKRAGLLRRKSNLERQSLAPKVSTRSVTA